MGTSSLPKKETVRVSKINQSAFKGKNFVTNSLYYDYGMSYVIEWVSGIFTYEPDNVSLILH